MNKKIYIFLFLSIFAVSVQGAFALSNAAKITVLVVDDEGAPIEGAIVGLGFEKNTGWETDATGKQGITGIDGRFVANGDCNGHITYGADKKGYYNSHYEYDFRDRNLLGWKPWNPELKVTLRKIENQVPMYARKIDGEIPVVGEKVGFDLIKGDWVFPYGKGVEPDFMFLLEKEVKSKNEMKSKLTVSFEKKFNGIVLIKEDRQYGSKFKLPRYAPIEEYLDNLNLSVTREPGKWFKESFELNDNYLFRVRSEVDDSGKLKKGMYGKILGPIKFAPLRSKTAVIEFKYYLNPDYTRNLEFDPDRNSFGPLPSLERVGIQ